ncbi:MAG: PQQ-binding-like beta-propeller repeat protein [Thermoplasmatota archaeon]
MIERRTIIVIILILMIIIPVSGHTKGDDLPDPKENSPMLQDPTWVFEAESKDIYPFLTADGRLYVFDVENNKLIQLNKNGFMDWYHDFENDITEINDFTRKSVYMITEDENDNKNNLIKLDNSKGSEVWSNSFDKNISDMIVNNKQIYISTNNGEVIKLSEKGKFDWNKTVKESGTVKLNLDDDGNLYTVMDRYNLSCYSSEGEKLWDIALNDDSNLDEQIIYLNTEEGKIHLFTNRSIYKLSIKGELNDFYRVDEEEILPHSFKRDNKFYILLSKDNISIIRAINENGEEKWEYGLTHNENKTKIMMGLAQNERIYCQFYNRTTSGKNNVVKILCFEEDGKLIWIQQYEEGQRGYHYISDGGKIYFISNNGIVYSYQGQPTLDEKYSKWTTTLGLALALFIMAILFMILNSIWKNVSEKKEKRDKKN